MKTPKSISLVLFIAISFLLNISTLKAQWTDAVLDTVSMNDVYDHLNIKNTLVIDEEDNLHMTWNYYEDTINLINYARRTKDGDWDEVTQISINSNSTSPVIDINPVTGDPVIAIAQGSSSEAEINLHYLENEEWKVLTLTNNAQSDNTLTIDIDETGMIHLAWIRSYGLTLKKLVYCMVNIANGSIVMEELEQGNFGTYYASPFIAFSPELGPVIAFTNFESSNNQVYLVKKDPVSSSWEYELINTPSATNTNKSIAISEKTIHLFLSGNTGNAIENSAIHYLKKPFGSPWSIPERINPDIPGQMYSDFFIDDNEKIHCVWHEVDIPVSPGTFHHSTNKNGVWESVPIIENQGVSRPTVTFNSQSQGFVFANQVDSLNFNVVLFGAKSIIISHSQAVGIDEKVTVYPNPISSELFFQKAGNQSVIDDFKLYDLTGNLIFEEKINTAHSIHLDRTKIHSGIYIYHFFEKGKLVGTGKVILE